jgi:hypothetical protein
LSTGKNSRDASIARVKDDFFDALNRRAWMMFSIHALLFFANCLVIRMSLPPYIHITGLDKLAPPPPAPVHVPGVPAVVQVHIFPAWSKITSPAWNVPVVGGPLTVDPTSLDPAVTPGRPEIEINGGENGVPVVFVVGTLAGIAVPCTVGIPVPRAASAVC